MYHDGTPFFEFFALPVPFTIPEESRFAHMHIVAGSGHGKTQTLQNLILSDLNKIRNGERSVIVIDSQGDMIDNILKLAEVAELSERVVMIYPKAVEYPPALNLFDFGLERVQRYTASDREMLINGAMNSLSISLAGLRRGPHQSKEVIFGFLARLLWLSPEQPS